MHESAYKDAVRFSSKYLDRDKNLLIADIGSYDVNGTLRPIFENPSWKYIGYDMMRGPNVDHVLPGQYEWDFIGDEKFDVVVSTQTLEHVRMPWRWVREIKRITKIDGLIYLNAPNSWHYHEYPIDCWRVWPEGMVGLFDDAGIQVVEAYMNGPDTTGIGIRRK